MSPTTTKTALVRYFAALSVLLLLMAGKPTMAAQVDAGAVQSSSQQAQKPQVNVELNRGTLFISYAGSVVPGMADFIADTFVQYRESSHRVVLLLNSGGGSIEEGEQVIHVLKQIRKTHRLQTVVLHGDICAS